MAALPAYMHARLGNAYHDGGGWVQPLDATIHTRSVGFARLTYRTARERFPSVPRWRLALATARICLRRSHAGTGRSAAT